MLKAATAYIAAAFACHMESCTLADDAQDTFQNQHHPDTTGPLKLKLPDEHVRLAQTCLKASSANTAKFFLFL